MFLAFRILIGIMVFIYELNAFDLLGGGRKIIKVTALKMDSSSININLNNVKNMRDIASVSSNIKATKILRTGCVSKASDDDIEEDESIRSKIYDGFQDFNYNKKKNEFVSNSNPGEKRRYFISLMSESLIKKGVFFRLQKRMRLKAVVLYLLSTFSRRAEKNVREIFISKINGGGLTLLNELVVDTSGKEIVEVLKLAADPKNYPIGIYCTAGKDRTGLITMLILSVCGVSDEDIIADYILSDSAYKDINDKKAMVASLKQVDVDPDTFLRAKPQVMRDTINYIRKSYGSINAYLDKFGFDEVWRNRLRNSVILA